MSWQWSASLIIKIVIYMIRAFVYFVIITFKVWRIATTSNSWSKFFNAEHSQVVRVDGSPDSPFNLKVTIIYLLFVNLVFLI